MGGGGCRTGGGAAGAVVGLPERVVGLPEGRLRLRGGAPAPAPPSRQPAARHGEAETPSAEAPLRADRGRRAWARAGGYGRRRAAATGPRPGGRRRGRALASLPALR